MGISRTRTPVAWNALAIAASCDIAQFADALDASGLARSRSPDHHHIDAADIGIDRISTRQSSL